MTRRRLMLGIGAALLVVAVVFVGLAVWVDGQELIQSQHPQLLDRLLVCSGVAGLGFIVWMVVLGLQVAKAIRLNLPQRIILAISVPAVVVAVVLSVEGGTYRHYWTARESWWVWVLAIVAVTAFELFLWRKRHNPGEGADADEA